MLESKPHKDNLEVQYTVMLSQSYQVPMLYITITNRASQPILNLDSFYELLVPSSRREELQKEGVFGSISLTVGTIYDFIIYTTDIHIESSINRNPLFLYPSLPDSRRSKKSRSR